MKKNPNEAGQDLGIDLRLKQTRIAAVLLLIFLITNVGSAQVRPIFDQGATGLGQLLKKLGNTKRIMHIGAHPDDEDSDMLAYLARKENARTVYLSLTRGDGGQNVIGPELFEALGVIRSEELLQARRLDGAVQMFTRAFDYGYSKTLAEARSKWNEEEIKCDLVRAIRRFRPQVVVPRFGGTPRDGHGQHQFAGYIAPIAVRAAADPAQCRDAGPVWKVLKFYVGQGFRDTKSPNLRMNTGTYDHLLGRSYYEVAALGRSQHKSQDQGGIELKGDRFSGVNLVDSAVEANADEKSMFDGVDTTYAGLIVPGFKWKIDPFPTLEEIRKDYLRAIADVPLERPQAVLNILLKTRSRLLAFVEGNRDEPGMRASKELFAEKISQFENAVRLASGLQIDALSRSETVTPGEGLTVSVNTFFPSSSGIKVNEVRLLTPNGWKVADREPDKPGNSRFARFFRERPAVSKWFSVTVPDNAPFTQPYYLKESREGYLYRWPQDGNRNLPFQPPLVKARVSVEIDGTEIVFSQPVEYRFADDTRGELRRNVAVVPAVTVDIDHRLVVIPRGGNKAERHLSLNIVGSVAAGVKGTARLVTPEGWNASPNKVSFAVGKKGESTSFDIKITIPPNAEPGKYRIGAVAEAGGRKYTRSSRKIAYDHIQTHRIYRTAEAQVAIMDLKVAPVRVGYVMGSGDSGPEALRQMGLSVDLLDRKLLTSGNLAEYDVIVIGIRASETNPAYVANNRRLLDYVKNGGTMIVQYQKFAFQRLNLAPYPIRYNARVSEEDAKVTILVPSHPIFNFPNRIGGGDFKGWVQERNLYCFRTFDKRYVPLLESHDTGEDENKGGMVYSEIGNGKYLYTSYAFFRQLPAGVPGAYRLFANIVSLGAKGHEDVP